MCHQVREGCLSEADFVKVQTRTMHDSSAKRIRCCHHLNELMANKPGETAAMIAMARSMTYAQQDPIDDLFVESPWDWFEAGLGDNFEVWLLWIVHRCRGQTWGPRSAHVSVCTLKNALARNCFPVP